MSAFLNEEAFNLLCGPQLGEGIHRQVFLCRIDPTLVVKVETDDNYWQGANAAEWKNWDENSYAPSFSKWLAPCMWISPNSRIMLQKRTTQIPSHLIPKQLPAWLMDVKWENFGYYDGRIVAHDYPQLRAKLGRRMVKVVM